MNIDTAFIQRVTGLRSDAERQFAALGMSGAVLPNSLTFLDDIRFLPELVANDNISGVICTDALAPSIMDSRADVQVMVSDDPRHDFYSLQNELARITHATSRQPTAIDPSATVHPRAYVAETGVVIGPHVQVHANVTVLEDVEIGAHSIIRSGTVLGAEGFEHKRTRRGILPVLHDGRVIIGRHVEIGVNNGVSKGFAYRHTIIGDHTKTDSLVHIAHGVQIGQRCLLPAACIIAGTVTIEDDVWIGPNASVSSQITIHRGAFITLGAVVTRDVPEGARMTGNFAIPHQQFMAMLKRSVSDDSR